MARVHIFGGPPQLMLDRHIIEVMARCLKQSHDIGTEERLAETWDYTFGGDDALAGCAVTLLTIQCATDEPREFLERVIMATDLLRRARRTKH